MCKKDAILEQCRLWLKDAADVGIAARYDELVASHNPTLSSQFSSHSTEYHNALKALVDELSVLLSSLTMSDISQGQSDDDDDDGDGESNDD